MSHELMEKLGLRLCFRNVDRATSIVVLGHDRAANDGEDGPLPYGQAWKYSELYPLNDPIFHVPYLPMKTQPSPWDSSVELEGAEERALRHQGVSGGGYGRVAS